MAFDDADTRFEKFDRPRTMIPGWEAQYRFGPIPGLGAFGRPDGLSVLDPRTIRAVDPQLRPGGYYRGDAPAIGNANYRVTRRQDQEISIPDVRNERWQSMRGGDIALGDTMIVPDVREERHTDLRGPQRSSSHIRGLGKIELSSAPGPSLGVPLATIVGGAAAWFAADLILPFPWNWVAKVAGAGAALYGLASGASSIFGELGLGKATPAVVRTLGPEGEEVVISGRIDTPQNDGVVRFFLTRKYPVSVRLLNKGSKSVDAQLTYTAEEFGIGWQGKLTSTHAEFITLPANQWVLVTFDMQSAHLGTFPSIRTVGTLKINDSTVASVEYAIG